MREETPSKMLREVAVGLGLFTVGWALPAEARSFRVNNIPNGSKFGCISCHVDNQASGFTNFGSNAQSNLVPGPVQQSDVNWPALCAIDSDGDGQSNGEELGDPDCNWSEGQPPDSTVATNPGVPNAGAGSCGNGQLDKFEPCDSPTLLGVERCLDINAGNGQLSCTAECTFDYSDCSAPPDGWESPSTPVDEEEGGCSVAGSTVAGSMGGGVTPALALGAAALLLAHRRRWFDEPRSLAR
jgi:hypothetical protein